MRFGACNEVAFVVGFWYIVDQRRITDSYPIEQAMRELTRTYSLRRFPSSRDRDYAGALAIYLSTVTPDIRTNSSQITYWLDRSYREFNDEFCVCGFYIDGKIIGFAEFAFFRSEGVLFLDYLSLHQDYQSQSEYLQFTRMVREWIDRQPFEFDFAATEITFEATGGIPTDRSILEVQLYKQMGFGVAHCKYRQPPLLHASLQSDQQAHLMVTGKGPISVVRKETLLHLVRTVYFRHYLRWYSPFLTDVADYERQLNERLHDIEEGIGGSPDIEVNGMKMLAPPIPAAASSEPMSRAVLSTAVLILAGLLTFLSVLFGLSRFANASWQTAAAIIGGSILAFVAVFALLHEPARRVLESLLATITRVFGRGK